MSAPDLLSELTKPLAPVERTLGGCARANAASSASVVSQPDPGAVLALWRLLVHVMGDLAPAATTVATWYAPERHRIRCWAERELCRKVVGFDGCPPLTPPRAVRLAATRWISERSAARAALQARTP